MNGDEIKSLLHEVFFEDEYKISEEDYKKYDTPMKRFYIKCYDNRLKSYFTKIVIDNLIIGTTIVGDKWSMRWSLPSQNYRMDIPGTSIDRNPKDVGDSKAFLLLSKEKLKDILLINDMNRNLLEDIQRMDKHPIEIIREYKLKELL